MSNDMDWTEELGELKIGRRRFRRRRTDLESPHGEEDVTNALLDVELMMLREENARLKAAQHQGMDVGRVLQGARDLAASAQRETLADDTQQVLVEAMVIRESLLVICREIERTMVGFEARLSALGVAGAPDDRPVGGTPHDSTSIHVA